MTITAEEIRSLINTSPDFDTTRWLLKKRLCPPDILIDYAREGYAEDQYHDNRWALTRPQREKLRTIARRHRELPQAEIGKYIAWGASNLRALDTIADILRNPNITTAMIEDLLNACQDEYDRTTVFRLCASHAHFPVRLYSEAVDHEVPYVRSSIVKNRAVPYEIIAGLLRDTQYQVQVAIVSNPIVPKEEIIQLLDLGNDEPLPHRLVLRAIMSRLPDGESFQRALILLVETGDPEASQTLARYTTDTETLVAKCYDPDPMVRRMAVLNPAVPEESAVAAVLLGIPPLTPNSGIYPRRVLR